MKMTSMKMAPGESEYGALAMPEKMPEYPYGLKLCLKEGSIKKLGIEKLPEVGSEMVIMAKVKVCERSEEESENRGIERELELQVMEMGIEKGMDSEKAAKALYKKG